MRRALHSARRLPPFLAFAGVGALGFLVNEAALFVGVHFLELPTFPAAFLAFLVTVTFTWYGNRTLTFHGSTAVGLRAMAHEWVRFIAVNGVGLAANYGTFAVLVTTAPRPFSSPYLALAVGSGVGLVFNFYASRKGVFRG